MEAPSSGYLKNRSASAAKLATPEQRPCNRNPIGGGQSQRGVTGNPTHVTAASLIDDGLDDNDEVNVYGTSPLDRNTDKDLLTDRIEIEYKLTDPLNPDTDGDGLSDGEEAGAGGLGTDPLKADTDGGGTPDGAEVRRGTNPLKRWDDN